MRKRAAQKVPSKFYDKVIRVNVPVSFFWVGHEFDGVGFGPFPKSTTRYQHRLAEKALDAIYDAMGATMSRRTEVPSAFLRAFKEEGDGNIG